MKSSISVFIFPVVAVLVDVKCAFAFVPFQHRHLTLSSPNTLPTTLAAASSEDFDAFIPGESTKIAYKDVEVGDGDRVIETGDVVTVSVIGTLLKSQSRWVKSEDFVYTVGEGKSFPGLEDGMLGAKVGSQRIVKVPASLGFGAGGAGATVPPNSDLNMDVTVNGIARGQVEATVAKIGVTRLAGGLFFLIFLVASPQLEQLL